MFRYLTIGFTILGLGFLNPLILAEEICPVDLDSAIENVIKRPEFERSRWGIAVQTLDSEEQLYSLEAEKYFTVASNLKLFTTAAALRQLGSDFRLRTIVYGTGKAPNLDSLRIVGSGDPSLTTEKLQQLAKKLKDQGVNHISQLIVEESSFLEPVLNTSWEWSDLWFYYAPSVNSLILNENAVILNLIPQPESKTVKLEWSDDLAASQWRVNPQIIIDFSETNQRLQFENKFTSNNLDLRGKLGENRDYIYALSIPDPTLYFAESWHNILIQEGISIEEKVIIRESLNQISEPELISIESLPLSELINKANQDSNNLYAEALLRILGRENNLTGVEAITNIIEELGVNENSFKLVDGSGLSRQSLVSPQSLVQLLTLIAQTEQGQIYRASLATAGVNGTLQGRFQDTDIKGNLQAKTGTLTGVSALSGYLDVPNYQPLVVSIIINNSPLSGTQQREAIDEIIKLLFRVRKC